MMLFVKALFWQLAVWLLSLLVLFLPAGTLAWLPGWVFFITFFGFVGSINHLKLLKRSMYGQAKLPLLRQHVLCCPR